MEEKYTLIIKRSTIHAFRKENIFVKNLFVYRYIYIYIYILFYVLSNLKSSHSGLTLFDLFFVDDLLLFDTHLFFYRLYLLLFAIIFFR